jgi:hypothetical protein
MSLKREVNRAARSLARCNIERCLSCKKFATSCEQQFKEEVIICDKFEQSYKNQVILVTKREYRKLKARAKRSRRNQLTLQSF